MTRKTALITGASSGFGVEFAKLFAKDGYRLVLVSSNEERLRKAAEEVKSQFPTDVIVIAKDLSLERSARELFELFGFSQT